MKFPGCRCTFVLFIAIIQILYGSMDRSVDCLLWNNLYCPRGTRPDMLLPICIPQNLTGIITPEGGGSIVSAPCPDGTQADEHGNCRQHLD